MSTRIRYNKTKGAKQNVFQSTEEFTARGQNFSVEISGKEGDLWVTIRNLSEGPSTLKGPIQTRPEALKAAKEMLVMIGVDFEEESRNRKPKAKRGRRIEDKIVDPHY